MTFINNFKIINKPKQFIKPNILMLNNNNPIIGSGLGIPLNILQYIYTNTHYGENIVNLDLIILQFCIGIFTYGTDRFLDALEYSDYNLDNKKKKYYDYLVKNKNINFIIIILSYLYLCNELISSENYSFLILLSSTLGYKQFKKNFGQFKSLYISIFWSFGTLILPCVLYDNNYEILNDYNLIITSILSMFGSSNLLDIKDVNEDKKENINTLPVLYGIDFTISISHISIFLAMIIFYNNNNFNNNFYTSYLYEIQNFGNFFLNFNTTNL